MMAALRYWLSKPVLNRSPWRICSTALPPFLRLQSFSSVDVDCDGGRRQPTKGSQFASSALEDAVDTNDSHDDQYRYREEHKKRMHNTGHQSPLDPIPNRPLRAEKPIYPSKHLSYGGNPSLRSSGRRYDESTTTANQKVESRRTGRQSPNNSSNLFPFSDKEDVKPQYSQYSRQEPSNFRGSEKQGYEFLEKFKLGYDKEGDVARTKPLGKQEEEEEMKDASEKPQEADDIFKKMKETGLIPNAVAMLDGLCKDGLVQDAMKLFGLMREKGTIPEVVIYTAVVDGFCKAQKLDDAKRIFKKMQNNGISPNAFSYTVLIQGLYKAKRLEDALDFCVEMLEAGHSPNLATFVSLVDGFCREKGLEEARSIIGALGQKGFYFDEKLVIEYLDKKGTFLPMVWEAILGKKGPQRSF